MHRILRAAVLTSIVMAGGASSEAALIVSGDSNIADDLAVGNFDNGRWFENILGTGTQVVVRFGLNSTPIANYYNTLSGVSASELFTPVTAGGLAGVDLFVHGLSAGGYTGAESALLSGFLSGGGTVLLIGEWSSFGLQNSVVNNLLTALGSAMALVPAGNLCSPNTLSGSQIGTDPLNAGVSEFGMACTSEITGGTPLFFTSQGVAMIAYEDPNGGSQVPEPSTLLLLGTGLLGVGVRRYRKQR